MKSIHRSILMRALMTGVASLAFMMMGAGAVRAETVLVQGANGANGADAVNSGEDGMPGGDGESVAAEAGSAHPVTSPQNQGTATGGSGGAGGNGDFGVGNGGGGFGGNGGVANATASTTTASGSAKANGSSFGGNGGAGGNGELFGVGEGGMAAMVERQLRPQTRQPSRGRRKRTPMRMGGPADPTDPAAKAEVTALLGWAAAPRRPAQQ
jgi:hypothetical protein